MYDYISPEKVMNALAWLKQHNPLYADIDINDNWFEDSLANDADLFAGLVKQPNTNNEHESSNTQFCVQDNMQNNRHVNTEPTTSTANNLVATNNDLTVASERLETFARENGFTIHDVPSDGNCLQFHIS